MKKASNFPFVISSIAAQIKEMSRSAPVPKSILEYTNHISDLTFKELISLGNIFFHFKCYSYALDCFNICTVEHGFSETIGRGIARVYSEAGKHGFSAFIYKIISERDQKFIYYYYLEIIYGGHFHLIKSDSIVDIIKSLDISHEQRQIMFDRLVGKLINIIAACENENSLLVSQSLDILLKLELSSATKYNLLKAIASFSKPKSIIKAVLKKYKLEFLRNFFSDFLIDLSNILLLSSYPRIGFSLIRKEHSDEAYRMKAEISLYTKNYAQSLSNIQCIHSKNNQDVALEANLKTFKNLSLDEWLVTNISYDPDNKLYLLTTAGSGEAFHLLSVGESLIEQIYHNYSSIDVCFVFQEHHQKLVRLYPKIADKSIFVRRPQLPWSLLASYNKGISKGSIINLTPKFMPIFEPYYRKNDIPEWKKIIWYKFKNLEAKIPPTLNDMSNIILRYPIAVGKTAIISPYAISRPSPSIYFWNKLLNGLTALGLRTIINLGPRDRANFALNADSQIFIPYNDFLPLVNLSGYFIGARSGLCDIASASKARLTFLYAAENNKDLLHANAFKRRWGLSDNQFATNPLELIVDNSSRASEDKIVSLILNQVTIWDFN